MMRCSRLVLVSALLLAATAVPLTAQQKRELRLSELAARALETHPVMASAAAGVATASAAADEAASARLPTLASEAQLTRFAQPMVVAPLHGFDPTRPPTFDRLLAQGSLSLNYTLFDGGARGARISRADALTQAAMAASRAATETLLAEVAQAYLRVVAARALEEAERSRLAALERERARAQRLFAEGRVARVAVLRADAAASRARADLTSAETQVELAGRTLARLAATPVDSILARPLADVVFQRAADDRATLLQVALRDNAEIVHLRSRAAAANVATGESRSAWLPTVRLAGRYVEYGSGAGSFDGEWQAGALVSFPVFTGGARGSAVARTDAEARAAVADVAAAELRVAQSIDAAWSNFVSADARVAALRDAVAQHEEVARIEKLALDSGAGVQTDYLNAEAELLGARAALTEALVAVAAARIELARVSGVLSPDWLATNLEAVR